MQNYLIFLLVLFSVYFIYLNSEGKVKDFAWAFLVFRLFLFYVFLVYIIPFDLFFIIFVIPLIGAIVTTYQYQRTKNLKYKYLTILMWLAVSIFGLRTLGFPNNTNITLLWLPLAYLVINFIKFKKLKKE